MLSAIRLPRRARSIRSRTFVFPAREWFVGVLLMLAILLGGLFYAVHLFLTEIDTEYFDVSAASVQPEIYKHAVIERVLTAFDARALRFEAIQNDTPLPLVEVATSVASTTSLPVE